MLEGTSLYDAYSFSGFNEIKSPIDIDKKEVKKEKQVQRIPDKINQKIYSNDRIFNNQVIQQNQKPVIIYKQEESYISKLISKKRDLLKIIQLSLIITLGLSIYYFINYYIDLYINTNDLSPDRQFTIRLLFPISIIIIIWNMRLIKFY